MASGGTIFLDEMAEMPPDIQVKLLRALETRQVRRLGGKKEITVDIRIVAATNKDLQKAIVDGELREDLYYRLAVVEIDLPPLRERADDIQLLANEFLGRFAQQNGKTITGFEDAALGLDHELPLARQRARAEERGRARGDHEPQHDDRPGRHHPAPPAQRWRDAGRADDPGRRDRRRGAAAARAAHLRVDRRRRGADGEDARPVGRGRARGAAARW